MNKLMMAVAGLALGGISTASLADGGNFFVNADVGQANYRVGSLNSGALYPDIFNGESLDKSDTAGALRFGYRWHSVVDFGVEAGYADLGQVNSTTYTSDGSGNSELKSRGWLLGGNLKYNINDNWYVSARGGWFRSKVESKGTGGISQICEPGNICLPIAFDESYNYSSTGTGEYLGAGAGYNFSSNFSVGLSYDDYYAHRVSNSGTSVNVALYSVSAEYRF